MANEPEDDASEEFEEAAQPMAAAMQWVVRVFAVSLMMVLPGLGGQWLDGRWQTRFFGPAGFVLGLVGGVAYLIAMTRRTDPRRAEQRQADQRQTVHKRDGSDGGTPKTRR